MTVVSVNNLSKVYGAITALKGVTLDVKPGEIYGLLGQNGAGKSTLIKILLGIISKTSGEATLLDAPAGDIATRRRVGYLPEDHRFPYYHTAESLLDVYGRLYGLSRSTRLARIEESLRIVGLAKRKQYKIKTFSKGMKQRLGIAQAIFHDPEVVFLDEPTDGIDPVGRKEIRDLLLKLKEDGRTIFFNSHLLNEVEMIADRVAILDKGALLKEGKVADLTRQVDRFEIGIASGDEFPWKELQRRGYPTTHSGNRYDVELPEGKSLDEVLTVLQAANVRLRHLVEKKLTLEEVFVSLVKSDKVDRERAIRELKGES